MCEVVASRPNHTVIYASASLLLAQELPIKTAIRAQQSIAQVVESDAVLLQQFADTAQITINAQNEDSPPPNPFSCLREYINRLPTSPKCSSVRRKLKRNYRSLLNMPGTAPDFSPVLNTLKADGSPVEFKTYDSGTDKEIIGGSGVNAKRISAASFAELFSQQRLEFRVYYDRTSYSRTKVIAPNIANERLMSIINSIERCGIRPRALAQDATNERYYAEQNRRFFRSKLPVILIVASQAVDKPGLDKPTNWKEYLGQQLVAKLDDNNLTLPPDDYTRVDYRLVMKDRGKFVCEPNDQGMHGDCFDADKLAGHALTASSNNRTIVAPMLGTMPPPFSLNSL